VTRERDERYPTDAFGLPEGLLAALVGLALLAGAFALATSVTPMPSAERWAALTALVLLGAGATLPGCAALYDALGRVVRADMRAGISLLALVPALYAAYAWAVRELTVPGLVAATLFAAVPGAAVVLAGQRRQPTLPDAVAFVYLAASLWLGLLPQLSLPQQGGLVGFFQLASAPLLLLLYAMRGWPGLGFTWHLSGKELRDALLAALPAVVILGAVYALVVGGAGVGLGGAWRLLTGLVTSYFFVALPAELLLRGGAQGGIERALRGPMGATARWVALAAGAALSALAGALTGGTMGALTGLAVGLAAGWAYQRTGKVTASALTHMLVVWIALVFAVAL
jgi:membrane protease YdiL (CAAX protease family)